MTISIMTPVTADDQGGEGPQILLVSPDLLSTSRIAGLAREAGGRLATLRNLDDPLPSGWYDLVLLDLQGVAERCTHTLSGGELKRVPLGVELCANPAGLQLGNDLSQVIIEGFSHRDGNNLHWREPRREGAGVMLGEHAKEPLDRTKERAVNHDRARTPTFSS